MALVILEDCTSCDLCVDECPNEAISEGEDIYLIEPSKCTECVGAHDEPQCQEICPVECIELDPNHRENKEQLLEKYQALHA